LADLTIKIAADDQASAKLADVAGKVDGIGTSGDTARGKLAEFQTAIGVFAGVAAGVATLGGGLYHLVNKTAELGEKLLDASLKTGLSVESLSTLKLGVEQANVPFDTFVHALYLFNMRISTAAEKAGTNVFTELGVKIFNVQGKIRPTKDLFLDVADALGDVESEANRARLAQEAFGRGGQNMVPLLLMGSGAITELETTARSLGLEMSTETAVAADTFRDSVDQLGGAIGALSMSISSGMIPVLTSGVGYLQNWVDLIRQATTFDPSRQQDMAELKTVTDEQAKAIQNETEKLGFFNDTLVTNASQLLTVKTRTVTLSEKTEAMRGTVSAAADNLTVYKDRLLSVRDKANAAGTSQDSLKDKAGALGTAVTGQVSTNLGLFAIDLGEVTAQADTLDLAWQDLDERLSTTVLEIPDMSTISPPPSEFPSFANNLGNAFTQPAGIATIETALINAFTNVAQGGSFINAISAVGVAIGTAIGGPAGGAIVSLATRAISAIGVGDTGAEAAAAAEAAGARATGLSQSARAKLEIGRIAHGRLISKAAMSELGRTSGWPAAAAMINGEYPELRPWGEQIKTLMTLDPNDPRYRAALSILEGGGFAITAQAGLFRVPGSPSTPVPAILHGQEMVLPAREAEMVRSGGGAGGVTINFNLSSASDREMVAMLRAQLPMITNAVSDGIRKGARFGDQEFDSRMIRSVLQS